MGEKLYNNIELPDEWPPRYPVEVLEKGQPVPYLKNRPKVIDISVGRQLFVDDFLIAVHNLYPQYHRAVKYEGNPVLKPETYMEKEERLPFAAPKDGAILYDRDEKKFKAWYEAGWLSKMAYAESEDGITWVRPDLGNGTNEILSGRGVDGVDGIPQNFRPDSTTVWIDYDTEKTDERYKLFLRRPGLPMPGIVAVSADGVHFQKAKYTTPVGDRSTVFYNPFRKKWVYSIRRNFPNRPYRARDYFECDDLLEGANWNVDTSVPWLCADEGLLPNPYIRQKPQLYNFSAVKYESIMLGLMEVWYGPENEECFRRGVPKITELIPVYSRDGFHFSKPSNRAVIQAEMREGAWDRGYIQSVGGCCIPLKDEIRIYYSGVSGDESCAGMGNPNDGSQHSMYSGGATGFATLRRDGFVSLKSEVDGALITKTLTFHGKRNHFFLNAATQKNGGVTVTILHADSWSEYAISKPFSGDSTCVELDFGDYDLTKLEEIPFRLRFDVVGGEIYSFWFSEDYPNG